MFIYFFFFENIEIFRVVKNTPTIGQQWNPENGVAGEAPYKKFQYSEQSPTSWEGFDMFIFF